MSQFSHALESLEPRQFLSVSTNTATTSTNDAVVPILVPATPQPTEGGVKLNEYSGQRFTAKLGEFHLKVSDLALNAVVNWGDGTKSDGKIEGSYATGEWYVEGTHKYSHTGTFAVKVEIFAHPIGSPIHPTGSIADFTSVIRVKKLQPTEGGMTLTEIAGQKFNDRLGEFKFKSIDLALNAVIHWGDGTKSDGKIVGAYNNGEYYVYGKHTYAHTGTYKVDVQIFGHIVGSPFRPTSPLAQFTSVIKVMDA